MPLPPGTSGDDVIDNSSSLTPTIINSLGGADVVIAGSGGDIINAGGGDDIVIGGNGRDIINGGAGADIIFGGGGNDVIDGGAGQDVIDGGSGNDVIDGGGGSDLISGGSGNDVIDGGGGDDIIDGGSGNDVVNGGGGDDRINGGTGSDVMNGGGGNDTFVFDAGSFGNDIINGFRPADDVIDLTALGITSGDVTLTQVDGNTVLVSGIPGGGTILVNGAGVTTGNINIQYCFMEGTMIRTPDGDRPIETLKAGDLVTLADGSAQALKWLAKQTIVRRFADTARGTPIRVRAGALGENTPSRDLCVSPNHALLIDGVLVQAGALVNGSTITEMTDAPERFAYYNLEFENHELVVAEGVVTESFLDSISRDVFDNGAEYAALFPDRAAMVELAHPRAKSARQVPEATIRMVQKRVAETVDLVSAA